MCVDYYRVNKLTIKNYNFLHLKVFFFNFNKSYLDLKTNVENGLLFIYITHYKLIIINQYAKEV